MSQTKFAILGMLTGGPLSGYDLKKMSEGKLAHFWHESYGNLYPRLAELEAERLVSSKRERRPGRPDATVYTLTRRGWEEFRQWMTLPAAPERVRSELLLKIFFGAHAPVEESIRQIEAYREQQQERRTTFDAFEELLRGQESDAPDTPYRLLTLRRGQLVTEARLRWCREALRSLAEMDTVAATAAAGE
jgi:DNA-binding PadR family transcriptional regulator